MKWEYLIEFDCTQPQLNKLGRQSWELISVVYRPADGESEFYFKRLVKS